jgi:hypothetical protein
MSHNENQIEIQISSMLEKVLEDENCLESLNLSDKLTDTSSVSCIHDRKERKCQTTKEAQVRIETILPNKFAFQGYNPNQNCSGKQNELGHLFSPNFPPSNGCSAEGYHIPYNYNKSQTCNYDQQLSLQPNFPGNYYINNYLFNNSSNTYVQSNSQSPYFAPQHKRQQKRFNTYSNQNPGLSNTFNSLNPPEMSPYCFPTQLNDQNFPQEFNAQVRPSANEYFPSKIRARKFVHNDINCKHFFDPRFYLE